MNLNNCKLFWKVKAILVTLLLFYMGAGSLKAQILAVDSLYKVVLPKKPLKTGDTFSVQFTIVNKDSSNDFVGRYYTNVKFGKETSISSDSTFANFKDTIKAKGKPVFVSKNIIFNGYRTYSASEIVVVWPTGSGLKPGFSDNPGFSGKTKLSFITSVNEENLDSKKSKIAFINQNGNIQVDASLCSNKSYFQIFALDGRQIMTGQLIGNEIDIHDLGNYQSVIVQIIQGTRVERQVLGIR
jgi:hypothetical protein